MGWSSMVGRSNAKGIFRSLKQQCYGIRCRRMMSSSPWLMLPPASEGGDTIHQFYSLSENKVLSLKDRSCGKVSHELQISDELQIKGSSHGWLCLFDKRNCDMFLTNPVTGRHINLPSIEKGLEIDEENLKRGSGCVRKVIVSGCPGEECRAVMIYHLGSLAVCCPGRSTAWTPVRDPIHNIYEDIIVYSGRVFCVTNPDLDPDAVECWDVKDPGNPRLDWIDEVLLVRDYYPWLEQVQDLMYETDLYTRPLRYLVFAEQSNQLYMVTRHLLEGLAPDGTYVDNSYHGSLSKTHSFSVHRIDREGGKLVYMEDGSLDGLAMFVGGNQSFAMSVADFPKLKPDSIYFTDDMLTLEGHDIGIFDYKNKTPVDIQSIKTSVPAPIWFTPTHP